MSAVARVETTSDYAAIKALTNESRQKLSRLRPRTLGQAGRVSGVTPADLQILWVHSVRLK